MLGSTVGAAPEAGEWDARAAWQPAFPPAWAVPVSAATLGDACDAALGAGPAPEGPHWFASIAPGSIRVGSYDPARWHRQQETRRRRHHNIHNEAVAWKLRADEYAAANAFGRQLVEDGLLDVWHELDAGPDPMERPEPRARIVEWSAKSRARMVLRLSTLDFAPLLEAGVPAMVTLTMPGRWAEIAPTGRSFKRLVRTFGKRYRRAWGRELVGVWKLEFQRRGAPHLHVLTVPPAGDVAGQLWAEWFSTTWADVLDVQGEERAGVIAVHRHPSAAADYAEGLRASDPKRIAVYFLKHNTAGDKEYQHIVPREWRGEGDGPGRFWGVWGLKRADEAVPITAEQAITIARTLRRWARAQGGVRRARVWRTDRTTGVVRARTARRRVRPMRGTRGFLVVNDGPAIALMLAALIEHSGGRPRAGGRRQAERAGPAPAARTS